MRASSRARGENMTRQAKERPNPIMAYWEDIEAGRVAVPQTIIKLYGGLVRDIETPRAPWVYDLSLIHI